MTSENERTTVIASTRTSFEADAIAQALQAAGFDARVIDTATAAVWGGAGVLAPAKVIVLEHQAAGARVALSQIRFEGQSIDWDAVDVGQPTDLPFSRRWSRSRRAMWTVAILLLPIIGLAALGYGVTHAEPIMQVMGALALTSSLIIVIALLYPMSQGSGTGKKTGPVASEELSGDESED